ncbi:MAG: Asp-tRNA(Asn)/Glu-tRNA(Gln) amidotransferase subunit GatC [Patescibacteria group bacterium]
MSHIGKKEIEHLAKLARLNLHGNEEEKLAHDLERILAHFDELKTLDTELVLPMSGGTMVKNVMRDDISGETLPGGDRAVRQFPEHDNGLLKVPHVFTPEAGE